MKKFILIAVLLLILVSFSGCLDWFGSNSIEGTWTRSDGTITYVFNKDNTGSEVQIGAETLSFNWSKDSTKANQIFIVYSTETKIVEYYLPNENILVLKCSTCPHDVWAYYKT